MIQVTYLDHSGFTVELHDAVLVFDYYRDPSHALHKLLEHHPDKAVVFFVSHNHTDHYNPGIFEIAQNHRRVYVVSNDVPAQNIPTTAEVAGMSAGDVIDRLPGDITVKAYGSTDKGVSFLVTLPDGHKIFHAGDLNDWHWQDESTVREAQKADADFDKILYRIKEENPEVYVAMYPVDSRQGSDYARGARKFLQAVKVANFFPMHFNGRYEEACDFASYAPEGTSTQFHRLHKPGSTTDLPC